MPLINIQNFGWGLDGKTFELTIAIPADCYLDRFYVATQDDIGPDNSTEKGTDYFCKLREYYKTDDPKVIFSILFSKVETILINSHTFDVYKLNNPLVGKGIYIGMTPNDLTFITMHLNTKNLEHALITSAECGEDNTIRVLPVYNALMIKLRALSFAKFIDCSCDIPSDFIDKILQLKALELALCSNEYYKAATYWIKFYKGKNIVTNKRCGCHG